MGTESVARGLASIVVFVVAFAVILFVLTYALLVAQGFAQFLVLGTLAVALPVGWFAARRWGRRSTTT